MNRPYVRIPKFKPTTRACVYFYYLRRDGSAQVVRKVEHRGGPGVPKHWKGPFPTPISAATHAYATLDPVVERS